MSSIMTKLPNEIIMNIIRMADGGLNTHKNKMNVIFEQIRGVEAIYWYEDDCVPPNLCSNYFPAIDDSEEDDSEEEDDDQDNLEDDGYFSPRTSRRILLRRWAPDHDVSDDDD